MATNFNPATKISVSGPLSISDKRSADMPLDIRGRIETLTDITTIPFAWEGMLVYVRDTKKYYKVTSLANRTVSGVTIPYYPATWVEFGSGGSTPSPSPTPSEIDAGDVSYFSSGTFSNNTVGKELQSLANAILNLTEVIGGKVAGIKVQGESSVLPMDINGIVTIPAGGGGTVNATWGSITGTIANQTDLINIASLTNYYTKTQLYTKTEVDALIQGGGSSVTVEDNLNSTSAVNALSANQGRVLKGLINEVNNKILKLGGDPEPIVIPPSAVELPVSTSNPDYIDYDSDTTYVMNIDGTQVATIHYPYIDNNNNYVAFKAIDRDLYYVYSVSVVNDAERYTYSNQYTWSTLPADAKSKFESGIYAIKQVINDDGTLPEKKWYKNIPSVFVDKSNLPLRTRRIDETISSSVIDVLLVKNDRLNKIYRYAFNVSHNTWVLINGGCYTKDDATTGENYIKYDAYFDRQPASNILFDDSITQLSTQEYPINNVQTAIQLLATKIYGHSSTLVITLTYNNGIRVANTVINISAIFQGNNYDFSSQLNDPDNAQYVTTVDNVKKFKTNSNGECRIGLPIGATYELTFNDITNYIKPEPITGITDSTQTIIGASYQAISDYETVKLKVVVHGVSGYVTPSGKKVYIDTYNQNNTSVVDVEGLYEITLNANGTPSTVKIKEGSSYTVVTDSVIKIDKGILYKVRLDNWDDTGTYTASTSPLFNAQKVNRGVTLAYTYTLSGTYLLLKDLESEDGYKNYRIVEIDSTNNKIKIAREINGIISNYWIYKNSNDVYIYEESQDISTAYAWFEGINVDANNPIVGIGFRSQLLNNPSSSARAISGTCAFCVIPYSIANVTAGALREKGADGTPNDYIDGLANEESWLEVDSPTSVITKNIHNITASIGNNTYNAFLPAYRQLEVIIQNIDNINLIFSIFNKSLVIAGNNADDSNLWSSTVNTQTNTAGVGANGWNKNMDIVGSSYRYQAYNSYKSIPVFPY